MANGNGRLVGTVAIVIGGDPCADGIGNGRATVVLSARHGDAVR